MRILAVEDGSFPEGVPRSRGGKCLLVGVIVSDLGVERVLLSRIDVDGLDATERLVEMGEGEGETVDLVMLASVSYGGFNLIDPLQVHEKLRVPVVVANPKEPDDAVVEAALRRHFPDWRERLAIIERVGHPKRLNLGAGKSLYFHAVGLPDSRAGKLIRESIRFGNRPEPLRIAHLLAHALSKGCLRLD